METTELHQNVMKTHNITFKHSNTVKFIEIKKIRTSII